MYCRTRSGRTTRIVSMNFIVNEATNTTSFKLIDTENNQALNMFDSGVFERWGWSQDGYQEAEA